MMFNLIEVLKLALLALSFILLITEFVYRVRLGV